MEAEQKVGALQLTARAEASSIGLLVCRYRCRKPHALISRRITSRRRRVVAQPGSHIRRERRAVVTRNGAAQRDIMRSAIGISPVTDPTCSDLEVPRGDAGRRAMPAAGSRVRARRSVHCVKFERSYPSSRRIPRARDHGVWPGIDRSACRRSHDDHSCTRSANQIAPAKGWAYRILRGLLLHDASPARAAGFPMRPHARPGFPLKRCQLESALCLWNSRKLASPFAESPRRSLALPLARIASH